MANIVEQVQWETGVYEYANGDLLNGGPDSSEVLPIKQLSNRTKFLRTYSVNPWQSALAPYPAEAYVSDGGKTWRSLVANNTVQPGTDPTKWEQWGFTLTEMRKGIMILQDANAPGVHGGNSLAGVNTRRLNTVLNNTIAGASLLNNQFTLPAGRFYLRASAPAFQVNDHQLALFNINTGLIVAYGTSENTTDTQSVETAFNPVTTRSELANLLVLTAPTTYSIRHYTERAATDGLGRANSSLGFSAVYTVVEIEELF
jgi:hypothetical protein